MATAITKIKRAIREGRFEVSDTVLRKISARNITLSEVISSVLFADEFDILTNDPSHVRYRLYGISDSGRFIVSVVFYSNRIVYFKTAYEE